jgi:hypothetical protein
MTGMPRMVKLADMWQRKSAKGTIYFSGYMGDCKILLFKEGKRQHPTKPDEEIIVWKLLVQERDPARRPQTRQPERSQAVQVFAPAREPDQDRPFFEAELGDEP